MFLSSQRYCKSFNLRGVNPPHLGPQQPCCRPAGKGPRTQAWEPRSHPHPWLHLQTAHLPSRKGRLGPCPLPPPPRWAPRKKAPWLLSGARWETEGASQPWSGALLPPPRAKVWSPVDFRACWEPPPSPRKVFLPPSAGSRLHAAGPGARAWNPLRDVCTPSSETTEKLKKKKKISWRRGHC